MSKIIKLGQYKNIQVNVKKDLATDEEVKAQIEALVAQNPLYIEKDGEVENGDVTTIDFEGFKDGVPFDGGKADGHKLEIGSGQFIPGFEDKMIGMKKGETRDLDLTFPENYGMKDLAGKDVVFKVTLHKIETKKDAELNDEFVASLQMPNITTVDELHIQMKNFVQSQHDQKYQMNVQNAVFDKLLTECEVEVNDEDVKIALDEHINQMRNELARQGMGLEQYLQFTGFTMESLQEQLQSAATQQAKFKAVIDEIAKIESLSTTDEEIDQQIDMIAQQYQMDKNEVLNHVNKDGLKNDNNRFKASQIVLQSANVSE